MILLSERMSQPSEGSLRDQINTFGKNRRVICLTTEEQVSGIQHGDMAEVHLIVDIDDTATDDTAIQVVSRLGVGELTGDGNPEEVRWKTWV